MPMNDAQKARLMAVLAKAFDRAALNCGTAEHAARFIVGELDAAGFKIENRKAIKRPRRDVAAFLGG